MARIGNYLIDDNVQGTDKVLGTDTEGQTKNYYLSDVGKYFSESNHVVVSGQVVYKFVSSPDNFTHGTFMITDGGGGNGEALSSIATLYISKNIAEEEPAADLLEEIFSERIQIYGINDRNAFYKYNVTSITTVPVETLENAFRVEIEGIDGMGVLQVEDSYAIGFLANEATGDKKYEHEQSSAAATWTIDHNLGKKPAVSVVDSLDNVVICEVEYTSLNQVVLRFDSTYSGKAYFN
jgi:hypothetical protein